jgi:hypothetical protein
MLQGAAGTSRPLAASGDVLRPVSVLQLSGVLSPAAASGAMDVERSSRAVMLMSPLEVAMEVAVMSGLVSVVRVPLLLQPEDARERLLVAQQAVSLEEARAQFGWGSVKRLA